MRWLRLCDHVPELVHEVVMGGGITGLISYGFSALNGDTPHRPLGLARTLVALPPPCPVCTTQYSTQPKDRELCLSLLGLCADRAWRVGRRGWF